MYPVLILRSELVCLVILVFLYFTAHSYNIDRESKTFGRILRFAFFHVIFDAVTVLTVNHLQTVPVWLNGLCHIIFYLTAILYSHELLSYVVAICYPDKTRKLYAAGHSLILLYILCLPFLRIDYVADVGTYSSSGPAAYVGYGLAFVFFVSALLLIFSHMKRMPGPIKSALIPMMLVLIITEIAQMLWRSVLFTGGAITIVTLGFFFSLENPVAVFKKKAMTDALTGVHSRSSYEEDIETFDRRFKAKPGDDYVFAFFDLNDLRSVNNRLGHAEGDNYITLIASSINRCMKKCSAVYRIGGDEFLILYVQVSDEVVEKEIRDLQEACVKASEGLPYTASVAAGYARSSASYQSLKDVVKTADYAMYQNKAKLKNGRNSENGSLGTKLNYSGLTDKIFDAICASNNRSYPFLTNLDTGVTRIAPGWKEYFGLPEEFYGNFNEVWGARIHPDDYKGYMDDIVAVLNGHVKYHHYDYSARKADGEYVPVSCYGSVYRDSGNGSNYFTGFIVNHGMDDNTDPVTGLKNFEVMKTRIYRCMNENRPFSVLKLKLHNFARINMLYGYGKGNEVIERITGILKRELGEAGEVFCQNSINFSILFHTDKEQTLKDYYRKITELLAAGMETERGMIPIQISGGAVTNSGEKRNVERMRGGLVFALEESQYNRRNQLVFYYDCDDAASDTGLSLLARIHADALGKMEYFCLRYQPVVDTADGKTVGAEALLRWNHPDFGEVPPSKFIAFIENDPCYYRLGLHILEEAVRDAARFRKSIPDFRIHVNITALQLRNENFAEHVFEILKKYDYAPDGLVLELTERCKEMDSGFLAKKIAELRNRGIMIAFDDLGTGYSTISLLMDIPVDEIKLDRNFVKDIGNRENYQLFVRALVLGSSSYGYSYNICFEGVESEEMLRQINGFGTFLAQGFYFAKPLPAEDFAGYIEKKLL